MTFDLGWDFRSTSGYRTDPSYACFAAYDTLFPNTYTNADGDSINAGWLVAASGSQDLSTTNDARLAGYVYGVVSKTFKIDLSSGSAPGAATYRTDIALGNASNQTLTQTCLIKDDTTTVDDLSGAGQVTTQDHYFDATGADNYAPTTWAGATRDLAFASTTVNVVISVSSVTTICHLRLTKQEAQGPTSTRRLSVRGA